MKGKTRTLKQIDNKIKQLKKQRKELPQYSFFGDNNWNQIDTQIETLKQNRGLPRFDLQEKLDAAYDQDRIMPLNWLLGKEVDF